MNPEKLFPRRLKDVEAPQRQTHSSFCSLGYQCPEKQLTVLNNSVFRREDRIPETQVQYVYYGTMVTKPPLTQPKGL